MKRPLPSSPKSRLKPAASRPASNSASISASTFVAPTWSWRDGAGVPPFEGRAEAAQPGSRDLAGRNRRARGQQRFCHGSHSDPLAARRRIIKYATSETLFSDHRSVDRASLTGARCRSGAFARSSRLRTFPVGVTGRVSTNSTVRGAL